ncbi:NERD domain-containing protein [Shewanella xiamenensis]|uniref:nuclease-related domain-containing DEAD/DEAH box helicase n=1 Tax=Shewanella xiamenensis TaxID=332186 RepID=UPI000849A6C5|nr:NERD domain-containing protein/DEAD/DEAH box helicase [Shewanella xiamenensis]MCL1071867.1 NERD domain-containing protein [Shewanella xiamenensis]ODR83841.1 nuclease [Shewanella xiamenensis]GGM98014.1 nuclease [Shewanella xiamenensis]
MANFYPTIENISRLKVKPTEGEQHLLNYLEEHLDDSFEVFFNPFLDGDRPDFIIIREGVAIFVIEVKDYNLDNYEIDSFNKWSVKYTNGQSRISSPQSQAFTYKNNLYQLHLSALGLGQLRNRFFFNLVQPFVYLHKADKNKVDSLYRPAENILRKKTNELFNAKRTCSISVDTYNRCAEGLSRIKKCMTRDKAMIFSGEQSQKLVSKIKSYESNAIFDDRVYDDLKRRLMPSEYVLKQGKAVSLDDKQAKLAISCVGMEKIKGVAGCGKTTIIAQRAVNAHERHQDRVLIITFNITLKNLIKDRISDILGYRDEQNFSVTNYHQFYNSQLNASEQDISDLIERFSLDGLYKVDCFKNYQLTRYQTILVDEVQDFESEWVKILRDNFLSIEGEMVLFADESQNIYDRDDKRSAVIAQGFGSWKKLKRSYRTSLESPLSQVFKDYQSKYLIEKYSDSELMETITVQQGFTFEILEFHQCNGDWENKSFEIIQKTIRVNNFNPNDVVILSSNIYIVRKLVEKFKEIEKTHCMFETYQELYQMISVYDDTLSLEQLKLMSENELHKYLYKKKELRSDIERARRIKKNHFHANSGLIKLSTIHSFKGLESKTVFYLMDQKDTPEVVYTSITRAVENLIVLDVSSESQFSEFFSSRMINSFNT